MCSDEEAVEFGVRPLGFGCRKELLSGVLFISSCDIMSTWYPHRSKYAMLSHQPTAAIPTGPNEPIQYASIVFGIQTSLWSEWYQLP